VSDFIPSGSGDSAKPIYLRDSSRGSEGQKDELGRFGSVVVGIVVKTDDGGFVLETRDGRLQPRNWHESEGPPISEEYPSLKDRRYSVALIADHQNGFGDVLYPSDDANPFKNDWPFDQKSTRIVDGSDPKGKAALFAQLCRVIDDLNDQYTAAIPFKRVSGSDKDPSHDLVATGYLYDADQKVAGLLDRVFTVNPADEEGKGRDGTVVAALSLRHDAIITHVASGSGNSDGDAHGPIAFDSTDVVALADSSTISGATEYKGKVKWDSGQKLWVPTFFVPSGGGGGGGAGPGFYADGIDGAMDIGTLSVSSGFADRFTNGNSFNLQLHNIAVANDAGTNVLLATLERDIYPTILTVPATMTVSGTTYPLVLIPGPYKIRCSVAAVVNGRICNDGFLGPWVALGSLANFSWTGGIGGSANGGNGGNPVGANKLFPQSSRTPGPVTSAGNGGGGSGGGGGSYGASSVVSAINGRTAFGWDVLDSSTFGSGAGGGGGQGASGGLGGYGAMPVFLFAPSITGSGAVSANGQKGASSATYGGGGGNPAPVLVVSDSCSVSLSSSPGAGGTGTTASGTAGLGAGFAKKFSPSAGTYT
jgi:hypothetical protein